ncbi:aspartate/glutamate racemase family protein [Thermoanaerobacterium sp. DL9XJH110]|uniref:aspartate/glutamate racemase family protein n=1 Tax=Thermoanaerobacterium sp. DL9XJH110 TaxID=3386643 RepID=UPI003BB58082
MEKIKVGLIRVVTLMNDKLLNAHAHLLASKFKNLDIKTRFIPDQYEGIYDDETEKAAIPKIIKLAKEFEDEGVDVVYISCAGDPGMEECRSSIKVPVIGAGSSCAAISCSLGGSVGIIGITGEAPAVMTKILGEKFSGYIKPEGVNTTLDLFVDEGRKNVLKAAGVLKEKGCDTIALACTGMSTINIHEEIKRNLKIRVVDPVLAAGLVISYLQF